MSDYLPEDVTLNIFKRLPIKSLIRFTCLSKRWNYIILSDTQFAKSQFQVASQCQTLTSRLLFHSKITETEYIFESPDLEVPDRMRELRCPFNHGRLEYVPGNMCCCNGLVCACFGSCIYIWNPTTGLYRELPLPEDVLHKPKCSMELFGFGYLSDTDDYKVFAVTKQIVEKYLIQTFSVRGNIWKKIEARYPYIQKYVYDLSYDDYDLSEYVYLNRKLHWCEYDEGNIIDFDLYQEEFRKMPLPLPLLPVIEIDADRIVMGFSLGGCLSLMTIIDPDVTTTADFWIMTEYGVADSWSIHFSFKIPSGIMELRFFLHMESSVFMLTRERGEVKYRLIRRSAHEEDEVEILSVREDCIELLGLDALNINRLYFGFPK